METTTASIFCCQLGRNFLHRRLRCKSRAFVLSPTSLGSKTSFPVETLQTNLFTTLIMSISSFLKTARFMCLISHLITPYSISCIDRRQLTELSSIDPSRRCLDTPAPRRGGAAEQPGVQLRVRCGLLPQQGNDSSEISFHVPLPCVQMRISGGTSPNIGPVLSSTCPAAGPVHKRRRESQQNEKSRRATFRDKRWHRLLLLLLIGYRSLGQCIQLSFVEVVFIHVGEVKPDWITQPEKLLLLPLNPAGQGPTAVLSTVFSF